MQIPKHSRFLIWLFALALSAWTLSKLPFFAITIHIKNLSWQEWLVWITLNSLIIYVGALRWSVLIRALKTSLSFGLLVCMRQAGQTVSFTTPGPQFGGEPLQIFWLCRRGLTLQKSLLSLGLDRFFELWINFSVLLSGVGVILISSKSLLMINYQLFGLLIILLIFITAIPLLVVRQPKWLANCFEQITQFWPEHPRVLKIKSHLSSLGSDFRFVFKTEKPRLMLALVLSLVGWVVLIGELLLLLKFVNVSLDFAGFAILLIAMRLALLLPIPGGLGTLEASVFWSFQLLNLPGSAALGLIALMRLRDATVLLVGLGCLRRVSIKHNKTIIAESQAADESIPMLSSKKL